jgi:hypothetical protein
VYSDANRHYVRHPITKELILQLRAGSYVEDSAADYAQEFGGKAEDHQGYAIYDFANLYAVKRVPRDSRDPLREFVRSLARQVGSRLRLQPDLELKAFRILAHADEVLSNPRLLSDYASQFSDQDDVSLAIHVPASQTHRIASLQEAVSTAHLDAPGSADIAALVLPEDEETRVLLSRLADVHFTATEPTDLMTDTIHVRPNAANRLRIQADLRSA